MMRGGVVALIGAVVFSIPIADVHLVLTAVGTVPTDATAAGSIAAVRDAAIVADGSIVVLDSKSHMLRLFSLKGQHLAAVGGGRDSAINAQAVVANGSHAFLYNRGAKSVDRFEVRKAQIVPRGTIPVGVQGNDLCLLGDTIVVVGDRRTSILHEFLIDGKPLRDFGAPLVDNETHEASAIDASGLVSCVRERHVVLFTSSLIPELRAYSTAGQLLWSHIVPGLRQVVVKHDPDGGAEFRIPTGGVDQIVSLFSVGSGVAGMQVLHADANGAYETILFDVSDGRVLGRQGNLPRIRRVSGHDAIVLGETPEPRVTIFHVALAGVP